MQITDLTSGTTHTLPGTTPVVLCRGRPDEQSQLHEHGYRGEATLRDVPVGGHAYVLSDDRAHAKTIWWASRRDA